MRVRKRLKGSVLTYGSAYTLLIGVGHGCQRIDDKSKPSV
jgi:hypothetical protein